MTDSISAVDFATLPLTPALLGNLASLGYREMTPIQAESLPGIMAKRDLLAQAKTGSGKTAAFGLGVLSRIEVANSRPQALILCPTRELADQVAGELRRLARALANLKVLTLCGGTPLGPQLNSLTHGAHVVVGTPGRVEEHLRKGSLSLASLVVLVLDEADRMLDMGFQAALEEIVAQTPKSRQTLLFSATYSKEVRRIAEGFLRDPLDVEVDVTHDETSIRQYFYGVTDEAARFDALCLLLLDYRPVSSVVFCNTRLETREVAQALADQGFSALALHGDLEQRDRDQALLMFANQSVSILVATDVAARGLDIDTLEMVFNYRIPRELEVYVHRVGRTGRAGAVGVACTLVSEKDDYRLALLAERLEQSLTCQPLPAAQGVEREPFLPPKVTFQIDGGKDRKIRPGDILGALTGEAGIQGDRVGKIKVLARSAYVAIDRSVAKVAFEKLRAGKIKGRTLRIRRIGR